MIAAVRIVGDVGVTVDATRVAESPTGIKVRIDGAVPCWVPRTQVLDVHDGKLVVTTHFARREGLL